MENLRGAKISVEKLRGMKNFHHFPKNTPTGYPYLKRPTPYVVLVWWAGVYIVLVRWADIWISLLHEVIGGHLLTKICVMNILRIFQAHFHENVKNTEPGRNFHHSHKKRVNQRQCYCLSFYRRKKINKTYW